MNAALVLDGQTVRLSPRAARMAIMLARHANLYEAIAFGRVEFRIARGKIQLAIENSAELIREDEH